MAKFQKNTHWRALFEKDKGDIQSVQPELINYANISDDNVMQLRCGLEREIKARFDESRPYGIPQWNLLACRCYSMVQFCLFLRKSVCDMCSTATP